MKLPSPALPSPVENALNRLQSAGFEAFLVGGCVRDFLLGTTPGDYDITTSARPEQTAAVFSGTPVIPTGSKHGTLTVVADSIPLEITTYRTEGTYSDHRRPDEVRFTDSVEEDLSRRDFTVNAMAWSPRTGLIDPFGGTVDLDSRLIRCVGDSPRRFGEDALRIMRALRFSCTLGFDIHPDTHAAILSHAHLLRHVSAERLYAELLKLLCGRDVFRILTCYGDVLGVFLPELIPMKGFDQCNPHHIHDVLTHTALAVSHTPPEPALRLAALFHDAGKPSTFTVDGQGVGHFYGHGSVSTQLAHEALSRLRCDRATRELVCTLVRSHDTPIEADGRCVRRWLNRLTPEVFFLLLQLKRADNLAQSPLYLSRQQHYNRLEEMARDILARDECICLRTLAVKGDDLLALGVPPGPEMGRLLRQLLDAVLDGRVPNLRTPLLALAEEKMRTNS